MSKRHTVNIIDGEFYDEEFWGPMQAASYVDPSTSKVYLIVPKQELTCRFEGELLVHEYGGWCAVLIKATQDYYDHERAKMVSVPTSQTVAHPPSWEMEEVDAVPLGLIPSPTVYRHKPKLPLRSVDDDWTTL